MEDRLGHPLAAFAATDGQWQIPLRNDQLSPHLVHAVLAVEDSRFYQHHGVDWYSVASAAWQDLRQLHIVRGASTISMQVARLHDPKPRSLWAKFEQAVRAYQFEEHAAKQEILCEYLNRAPFGGNFVGAGAASWRYFDRPCRELSLGQAALLAGLPQSPNRFRPDRHPAAALQRRGHVLDRMLACGAITPRQYAEAQAETLDATLHPLPQDRPPGTPPADGALPTLAALVRTNPVIRVTLEARIQQQACHALAESLHELAASGVSAGALVVLDTPTAEPLALVSLGPAGTDIDLTRRPRSTGSTLKPFIYAAAFDAGLCTPATILQDSPAAWPGYIPNNYDRQFRGPLSAAEALAESRNIPAMLVLEKVGIPRTIGLLQAAGFATLAQNPHPYGLALAIGGAEATPLEVAQAYATLARGGHYLPANLYRPSAAPPSPLHPITSSPLHPPPPSPILPSRSCWQVLTALSTSDRTARICPEAATLQAAWKTGTSSDHRDAWCAAVTPRRTVVVWLGNLSGSGTAALIGQEAAAPVALKLIAAMDPLHPTGPTWPQVEDPAPPPASPSQRSPKLWIVSPTNSQEVILRDDESPTHQRVFLSSAGGAPNSDRWWFLDNQPLARTTPSEKLPWLPIPGHHTLRVIDNSGHTATTTLSVRGSP